MADHYKCSFGSLREWQRTEEELSSKGFQLPPFIAESRGGAEELKVTLTRSFFFLKK
jgi:hypothetical protein